MGLISKNTRWFFILPSTNEAEVRHIYDIAFGVKCLLSKNISYSDIVIIIDNSSYAKVRSCFSNMEVPRPSKIYATGQLDVILESNTYENAVIFITGHGSPDGLDTQIPLKPYPLYKKFQTAPCFKRVVFYLGQCYAGIFNQMPLPTHLGLGPNADCDIVAIGSTGLFSSISAPLDIGSVRWSANIFLAYVLNWILNPQDIDGDERFSVMDSFKSASINTSATLIDIKKKDDIQSILEQAELMRCVEKLSSQEITAEDKDNLSLEIQALEKILEIRYTVQEPWILHTAAAMETVF